ncbi:MAG: hypothetical protein CL661_02155 [Bacteroidetes bacterium]|jgi:hypothetical protein|nr:hypothetical protein [Bacteroidota bacterium]|tara:strand:+ start:6795 stop:7754 length:960 start_codon:yes stop_codon:yes gene_type:complete
MKETTLLTFLMTLFILSSINNYAQITDQITKNPEEAKIIYTDVENFIIAYSLLGPDSDTMNVIQKEYIDKGTAGLFMFIEKYNLSAKKITNALKKYPEHYAAIPERLEWFKTQEKDIHLYFSKLQYFLPHVVFPPTYFLIGAQRGINSASSEGQLITIDKSAANISKDHLSTLIIHELLHFQQVLAIGYPQPYLAIYGPEKSLLAITIREGIAEFFADLVTGEYTQDQAKQFVLENEKELWKKFQREMNGKETGDWMWEKPDNPNQPRDIGYVFGALIVEYYYKHAPDVFETTKDILSVTDYPAFLERTEYQHKFDNVE